MSLAAHDPKIVITGTGRAGTTLLVQILDALGLDTGINTGKLVPFAPGVRAGLECRVDDPDAPRVVKDMTLGFRMQEVLESGKVEIEHVILPTRRLDIAAASRIRAADYGRLPFRRGALTGTLLATQQVEVLQKMQDETSSARSSNITCHTRSSSSPGSRPMRTTSTSNSPHSCPMRHWTTSPRRSPRVCDPT